MPRLPSQLTASPAGPPPSAASGLSDRAIALFADKTGSHYVFKGVRDLAPLRALLNSCTAEDIARRMTAYFNDADDYVRRAGYPLGLFIAQFNRFVVVPDAIELSGDQDFDCGHHPRCKDAAAHTLRKVRETMRATRGDDDPI